MRRFLVVVGLVIGLLVQRGSALAHDAYDDSQSHPMRLVAYALNPVGWSLEWLVFRPLHFVVSQPSLEPIFGHGPHSGPLSDYGPYGHEEEER